MSASRPEQSNVDLLTITYFTEAIMGRYIKEQFNKTVLVIIEAIKLNNQDPQSAALAKTILHDKIGWFIQTDGLLLQNIATEMRRILTPDEINQAFLNHFQDNYLTAVKILQATGLVSSDALITAITESKYESDEQEYFQFFMQRQQQNPEPVAVAKLAHKALLRKNMPNKTKWISNIISPLLYHINTANANREIVKNFLAMTNSQQADQILMDYELKDLVGMRSHLIPIASCVGLIRAIEQTTESDRLTIYLGLDTLQHLTKDQFTHIISLIIRKAEQLSWSFVETFANTIKKFPSLQPSLSANLDMLGKALVHAAAANATQAVTALLETNPSLTQKIQEKNALDFALEQANPSMIEALLQAGLKTNSAGNEQKADQINGSFKQTFFSQKQIDNVFSKYATHPSISALCATYGISTRALLATIQQSNKLAEITAYVPKLQMKGLDKQQFIDLTELLIVKCEAFKDWTLIEWLVDQVMDIPELQTTENQDRLGNALLHLVQAAKAAQTLQTAQVTQTTQAPLPAVPVTQLANNTFNRIVTKLLQAQAHLGWSFNDTKKSALDFATDMSLNEDMVIQLLRADLKIVPIKKLGQMIQTNQKNPTLFYKNKINQIFLKYWHNETIRNLCVDDYGVTLSLNDLLSLITPQSSPEETQRVINQIRLLCKPDQINRFFLQQTNNKLELTPLLSCGVTSDTLASAVMSCNDATRAKLFLNAFLEKNPTPAQLANLLQGILLKELTYKQIWFEIIINPLVKYFKQKSAASPEYELALNNFISESQNADRILSMHNLNDLAAIKMILVSHATYGISIPILIATIQQSNKLEEITSYVTKLQMKGLNEQQFINLTELLIVKCEAFKDWSLIEWLADQVIQIQELQTTKNQNSLGKALLHLIQAAKAAQTLQTAQVTQTTQAPLPAVPVTQLANNPFNRIVAKLLQAQAHLNWSFNDTKKCALDIATDMFLNEDMVIQLLMADLKIASIDPEKKLEQSNPKNTTLFYKNKINPIFLKYWHNETIRMLCVKHYGVTLSLNDLLNLITPQSSPNETQRVIAQISLLFTPDQINTFFLQQVNNNKLELTPLLSCGVTPDTLASAITSCNELNRAKQFLNAFIKQNPASGQLANLLQGILLKQTSDKKTWFENIINPLVEYFKQKSAASLDYKSALNNFISVPQNADRILSMHNLNDLAAIKMILVSHASFVGILSALQKSEDPADLEAFINTVKMDELTKEQFSTYIQNLVRKSQALNDWSSLNHFTNLAKRCSALQTSENFAELGRALVFATAAGSMNTIRTLVAANASTTEVVDGKTALDHAIAKNNAAAVEMLLRADLKLISSDGLELKSEPRDKKPLAFNRTIDAVFLKFQDNPAIRELCLHHYEISTTALMAAMMQGHPTEIQKVEECLHFFQMQKPANEGVDTSDPFAQEELLKNGWLVRWFNQVQTNPQMNAANSHLFARLLEAAAKSDRADIIKILTYSHVVAYTPEMLSKALVIAIDKDNYEAARVLLRVEAQVPQEMLTTLQKNGSYLMLALINMPSFTQRQELVMLQEQFGTATLNILYRVFSHTEVALLLQDKSKNHLIFKQLMIQAVTQNNPEALRALIHHYPVKLAPEKLQSLLNQRDENGDTALHLAVKHKNYEIVHLLLTAGAHPKLANHQGKIPEDLADIDEDYLFIKKLCRGDKVIQEKWTRLISGNEEKEAGPESRTDKIRQGVKKLHQDLQKKENQDRPRAYPVRCMLKGNLTQLNTMRTHYQQHHDFGREMITNAIGYTNSVNNQGVYKRNIESFNIEELNRLLYDKIKLSALKEFLVNNLERLRELKTQHRDLDALTLLMLCMEESISDTLHAFNYIAEDKLESSITSIMQDELGMSSDEIEDEMRRKINTVNRIVNPTSEKELKYIAPKNHEATTYQALQGDAFAMRALAIRHWNKADYLQAMVSSFWSIIYSARESDRIKHTQLIEQFNPPRLSLSNNEFRIIKSFILAACNNAEIMAQLRALKSTQKPMDLILLAEQLACRSESIDARKLPDILDTALQAILKDQRHPMNQVEMYTVDAEIKALVKEKRKNAFKLSETIQSSGNDEAKSYDVPVAFPANAFVDSSQTLDVLPSGEVLPCDYVPVAPPANASVYPSQNPDFVPSAPELIVPPRAEFQHSDGIYPQLHLSHGSSEPSAPLWPVSESVAPPVQVHPQSVSQEGLYPSLNLPPRSVQAYAQSTTEVFSALSGGACMHAVPTPLFEIKESPPPYEAPVSTPKRKHAAAEFFQPAQTPAEPEVKMQKDPISGISFPIPNAGLRPLSECGGQMEAPSPPPSEEVIHAEKEGRVLTA